MKSIFYLSVFALVFALSIISIPDAHAFPVIIADQASCETIHDAVWSTSPDKCTLTSDQTIDPFDRWVVNSGITLTVNPGVTLTVSTDDSFFDVGIDNQGTITNSGTITVSNTFLTTGIDNHGTITNNAGGLITVSNAGTTGIENFSGATITNSGTINNTGSIINSGTIKHIFPSATYSGAGTITGAGKIALLGTVSANKNLSTLGYPASITTFDILSGDMLTINSGITLTIPSGKTLNNSSTINNNGTITISNTGGIGISNSGTLTNNSGGLITISNTDGTGIYNNSGTITNSGTIAVSNTGPFSIGIENFSGTLTNNSGGLITISNTSGTGILNEFSGNTLTNSGTITVSNTSGTGILNEFNAAITNNSGGLITVSNTGSAGIANIIDATITNSGTITISNTGVIGIQNTGGSIITNNSGGLITVSNTDGIGIQNIGTLTNNSGGTITVSNIGISIGIENFSGIITNNGTITVSHTGDKGIDSTGTITNNFGGTITNSGFITSKTITNNFGAIITNNSGGLINNSVSITNDGTINNKCGGTINNSGTFTGNPINNIVCDTTNPDTTISGAFDGKNLKLKNGSKTVSTSAKFFFIGSDNIGVTGFQCSLDGQPWNTCTSPVTYNNLQKSITHVFMVRSLDAAGNADASPATFTWKISNTNRLTLTLDYGVTATVFGTVFTDTDGDGTQGIDELGIANRTMILVDGNGNRLSDQTTDVDGTFLFTNVAPGTILVQAAPVPQNHLPSTGFNSYSSLAATVNSTTIVDFPMTPITPQNMATVTGTVFEDTNDNGIQDGGEAGIAGVQVFVVDFLTLTQTTVTTDTSGVYTATGILPDVVLVQAAPIPAGHIPTTTSYSFPTLTQGTTTTVNFALKPVTPSDQGTILIDVFNDINSNGIKDVGETGVSGAVVFTFELLTAQADVQVTTSTGVTTHSGLIPDVVLAQINASVLPAGFTAITTSNGGYEFVPVTPGSTTTVKIGLH